jgi:pimeloyl-ACP methyl ester carboxylesterase
MPRPTSSGSSGTSQKSTVVRSEQQLRLARAGVAAAFALSDDLGAAALVRLFTTPRRFARPPREAPIIERGKRFVVSVARQAPRWRAHDPLALACWRWGQGPTVLLVHGWEGRGSQMGALVEPLVAAGFSVVTFDGPGHGDSAGNRLLLPDFADAVAAVARAVGPVHATIAHSFGGAATLLARSRAGADVGRLALIAPNLDLPASLRSFGKLLGLSAHEAAAFQRELSAQAGMDDAELELPALLGAADAPLLLAHDQDDAEIDVGISEAVVGRWPCARLLRTTGLGHRRILRDPDVLDALVGFVAAGAATAPSELTSALGPSWGEQLGDASWSL